MKEVTILSVYGRGFWIASQLKKRNIKVKVIDYTDHFEAWKPEDIRNPIGVFYSGHITDNMWARMHIEDDFEPQKEGLCVWTTDGPVHFKSSLVNYYLRDTKKSETIEEILKPVNPDKKKKSKIEKFIDKVSPLDFDADIKEMWILKLSRELAATSMGQFSSSDIDNYSKLQSDFSVGDFQWEGYLKACQWLADKGVAVVRPKKITKDLDIYISGEKEALCFLTAEELKHCGLTEESCQALYKAKMTEPEWCWTRCRIKIKSHLEKDVLPSHFIIIDRTELPLSHGNMLVFTSSKEETLWDVSYRVPLWYEDDINFVKDLEEDILKIVKKKIPSSTPALVESSTIGIKKNKRGPLPYCLYSEKQKEAFENTKIKSWVNLSPEVWPSLDWEGRFKVQKDHIEKVVSGFLQPDKLTGKMSSSHIKFRKM